MDITKNFLSQYALAFSNMLADSEDARIALYRNFSALYDQDAEECIKIMKNFYLDRPFSRETLNRMPFVYDDIIEKVISRKTAGLISKQPSIELVNETNGEKELFDLAPMLSETNFFEVIQDALQRAEFFNTVILQPVYRNDQIQIDVITPDECSVQPADDYLKIKAIAVFRVDEDGLIYAARWTDDEHTIVTNDGEEETPEDNPNGVNPYGRLPFVVFRRRPGRNFWGEPNWSLYHEQLNYLMSKNDTLFGEYFQKFPIVYGVNFPLANGQHLSPAEFISAENSINNQTEPRLAVLQFQTDWANIRENQRARIEQFYINQGLPASSFAVDRQSLSGDAKEMDEKELEESRDRKRASIVKMVRELLDVCRMVWNYHKQGEQIPENGYTFNIQLNDANDRLAAAELKALREMQVQYRIADPITFIMQDLEMTEEQAIEHYRKISARMSEIEDGTRQAARKVSILDFINAPQQPNEPEAV